MCITVNNAIAILRMYGGVLFWLWRSYFVLFPWWNQICISVLRQDSSLLGSKDSAILNSVLGIAGHGHRRVLRCLPGVGIIMIRSFGDWRIYGRVLAICGPGRVLGGQGGIDIYCCVCFDSYCRIFLSGRKTGQCAVCPPKFRFSQYFLIC